MSEQILAYYSKHRQIVEERLHASNDPGDVEAIHDFRTSVKRIRVVAALTEWLTQGTFAARPALREIDALFKASGKLRDIQVTKYLLGMLHDDNLDPLTAIFNSREQKQRAKFEFALHDFPMEAMQELGMKLEEALGPFSNKHAEAAAQDMLIRNIDHLHDLYHGRSDEKRLHKIRTRLKDINYLNNIFDEQLPVQDHLNISFERLRELGELAGHWHDHYNLESKLAKYIKTDNDILHREALREIKFRLKEKKEELQQEYCCILVNELRL